MVKIEYDLNNAEHCEMVNDYFYIKYFLECLSSDWGRKVVELLHRFNKKEPNCQKDYDDLGQIIMKHTNKYELDFVLEILYKNDIIIGERNKEDTEHIIPLITHHKMILSEYKQLLIDRFSIKTYRTFKFS